MSGLEGVVFGTTRLSRVDGDGGSLLIGGYPLAELAGEVSFEAVTALLLEGCLPEGSTCPRWRERLGQGRLEAYRQLLASHDGPDPEDPMDALRARVAGLVVGPEGPEATALRAAAPAVLLAAWCRRRGGEAPVAPDPVSGHAADLLRMLRGREPGPEEARALDTYMVTVVDHGMNASTFAARVVASTGSDPTSAVTAALGALKGPRHGGAPGPVLDMLDAIGDGDPAAWIQAELGAGRRLMGMGHRVYRVRDPRAAALEGALLRLRAGGDDLRLAQARRVEAAAEAALAARYPGRTLRANVEFYTAVLLEALGIPRAAFTAVFAAARVVGWLAHVAEQSREGRLIRPRVEYVGPVLSRTHATPPLLSRS